MKKCPICNLKKTNFAYKIGKYFYYFCENCSSLFLYPQLTAIEIKNYYQKKFDYQNDQFNKNEKIKQLKNILKEFKKINPKGKKLLDIGCGDGFFLYQAYKNDFIVEGIEPSINLYKKNQSLIKKKIKIYNLTFENYFKKYSLIKKFDFIVLIHVIEHIKNPINWLKMIKKLLNKNGAVYIETPNLDSFLYYVEKEKYTFLTPPDHLFLFSKYSFKKMLSDNKNFEIIKIDTYSFPQHLMGIIKRFFYKKIKFKNQLKNNHIYLKNKKKLRIKNSFSSRIKYLLFDKFLAPIFTPLLNINNKGSILQIYLKKK